MARRVEGTKGDDWRRRLAKFDSSGLTIAEFCRREKVSQASFYYWSKRIPRRDRSKTAEIQAAVTCSVTSHNDDGSGVVEVVVGDTIRVRMPAGEPAAVAALIRHLQDAPHAAGAPAATSRFQRIELTGKSAAPS